MTEFTSVAETTEDSHHTAWMKETTDNTDGTDRKREPKRIRARPSKKTMKLHKFRNALTKVWPLAIFAIGLLTGYFIPRGERQPGEPKKLDSARVEDGKPSRGLCMIDLWTDCHPCDRIKVLVHGEDAGEYRSATSSDEPRNRRIYFQAGGRTHFVFQLYRGDELQYQPEFDLTLQPGAIISASFRPSDPRPPTFETPYYCSSPRVGTQSPGKVWCYFDFTRLIDQSVSIELHDTELKDAIQDRIGRDGYTILRQGTSNSGKNPWFTLQPPQDKTVVEAIKELELWPGVESAGPNTARD